MRWTKKSIFLKRFEINRDSWESFFCVSLHPKNKYFLGKKNARAWATNSLFVLPGFFRSLVEISGLEPLTSALQGQRSTNWAIPPNFSKNVFLDHLWSWWAMLDLNQRPHPYQGCALTNWANSPLLFPNTECDVAKLVAPKISFWKSTRPKRDFGKTLFSKKAS